MTMMKKEDIIEYIDSNYKDALYNLHLYKKPILEELLNLFNSISEDKNDIQINAEKYFIESIIEGYSEKMKIFYNRKF